MSDERTEDFPNSPEDENVATNNNSDLEKEGMDSGEEETSEDDAVGEDSEGDASDDSLNGTLDKCPICLRIFRQQEVGTPDTCEHGFCLKCILEWSDNVTTCPIDRKTFHSILILDKVRGQVVRVQELVPRAAQLNEDYDEFSDPTFCEVCGCCDREHRLLLCDDCDDGYHLECLDPPLETVPTVDWYCSACATARVRTLALSDAVAAESTRTRMPRTGLSRRIMQRRRRDSAPNSSLNSTCSTSECLPETRRNRSLSNARSTRSATRVRKRATTTGKRLRTGWGKRRVRKKRTRKQRVALERKPATPRGRLIQQLGIQPPRPGQVYVGLPSCRPSFTLPTEPSTSASAIRTQRHQAGIAPLRIYSTVNDLADYFEESSDEEGGTGVMRPQPIRIGDSRKRVLASATAQPASSVNVLGPILSRQHILLQDKNIQISSGDGRLVSSMSVNPDKLLFSPNNENDSSGYDSFGNRGSPSRIRSHGTGSRGIVTSALNSGGKDTSNTRGAGGSGSTGSSNPSTDVTSSSSENSRVPTFSGSLPSHSLGSSAFNNANNSTAATNSFEDFGVLDEPVNKLSARKKDPIESEKEDDEFNIYSDIEDEPRPPTIRRISDAVPDPLELPTREDAGGAGGESDNDMVIDEADAPSGSGPRERESRGGAEFPANIHGELRGDDVLSENGSESLPPGDVDPDSPLSIPLPDSTPPPSVREGPSLDDEDTNELSSDSIPKEDEIVKPIKEKDEYDPSHPLTSSEDEDEVPLPHSQPPNIVTQTTPPQKSKPVAAPPVEVSAIPLPGDEYRRPTIQFSIPSRHRMFSMGSLVRRNKGVMKKETKAGGGISFQSEMSKAFARKADEPGTSGSAETEKGSLVAEIFGSDEEDEEDAPLVPPASDVETQVPAVTIPTLVAEIPVEAIPVVESTTEGLEGSKWRKIVDDEPEVIPPIVLPKCLSVRAPAPPVPEIDDDDVVVIGETLPEVQIIETPPPEPEDEFPSSRDRQHKKPVDPLAAKSSDEKSPKPKEEANTAGSVDSPSDSENEFERQRLREKRMNAKKKGEEKRRDPRSKSPKKDKENKRIKRRRSLSAESNCEEGEILDIPDKKKKKTKKSKKSKKRRRSTRSRSSSSSDHASFSEKKVPEDVRGQITEDEEGSKDVHWKKPSKSSKERNYRDGKPKAEEKYFRERDKQQENEPVRKNRERDKSPVLPMQPCTSQEDNRRDRSRSKEKEKRASRRTSRSRGKRTRSRHSNRSSSSIKNFRSRSRSTNSRSSKAHYERRHREHSFSPNRRRSPPTSSRSRRTSHRSRTPVQRSQKRSRSNRSRQFRQRSPSSSRSPSTPPQRRRQRSPPSPERTAPKKSKDTKEKKATENKEIETSVSLPDSTKEKAISANSGEKEKRKKKKRREKSISPAKAIFADGDSIVVSLNFQKGKEAAEKEGDGKNSGDKNPRGGSSFKDRGSGEKSKSIKKTVLIDLESSPIQEQDIGVSPTLIVLSDDEEGHDRNFKADDSDQERLAVSTTSTGDTGKSPLYRGAERDCLGVPADSTQLQPHAPDGSKGTEFPHVRNSASESDPGNTPARGDALVTSTRDSMDRNGVAQDEYPISPCTPPKDSSSPTDMSISPPLPPGSPPPLPAPRARSPDLHPKHNPSTTQFVTTPNAHPILVSNPALPPRPIGIGSIPGLFPSNKLQTLASGSVLGTMPVVIPNPPMPQLRLPPPNLFNQSVLATVANALYGPLMGAHSRYGLVQQQGAAVNANIPTSRMPGNVIGKKPGVDSSVLIPKDQNFTGHRRTEGGGDSPFSPNSSDGDDLFEPPKDPSQNSAKNPQAPNSAHRAEKGTAGESHGGDGGPNGKGKGRPAARIFDSLFGGPIRKVSASGGNQSKGDGSKSRSGHKHKSKKGVPRKPAVNLSEGELRLTEEVPTSAVELRVKEKFLKKLNRQERVVEEVKVSLKPHYSKKHISKEEYKDILRRAVPKICHNKTGEINPIKIKELIEAYVKKCRKTRKK